MVTIGRIPGVVNSFFRPQRQFLSQPAWPHFWGLVTAMSVGLEHTVGRLAERIATMKKLGEVKVVFSRRRGDHPIIALVTDDLERARRGWSETGLSAGHDRAGVAGPVAVLQR